jgi:DNA mismatch repair protein MSH6
MSTLLDDERREVSLLFIYSKTIFIQAGFQLVFLYKLAEGVALGSFGTHVANLAGVPPEVVERAEVISEDFARQFKEKMKIKEKKSAGAGLPLVAQADFAYLHGLASGKLALPENEVRRREVLLRMKEVVRNYFHGKK